MKGSGQYGTAGQACVGDRQQGACHYQSNGACWNWFVGYRDPIANDPHVAANAAASPLSSVASSILPASVTAPLVSAGIDPTLLIGGAILGVVVILLL